MAAELVVLNCQAFAKPEHLASKAYRSLLVLVAAEQDCALPPLGEMYSMPMFIGVTSLVSITRTIELGSVIDMLTFK